MGAGAHRVMSEPGEAQGSSQTPAAGPAVSGPGPLPSPACRVPTGRPLPHSLLPSPASPSPAAAPRQADLPGKARVTAIGRLPARYLVRHGIGGFPRGLRTAAASGTQNLAPGFTNPSLFPTAQHGGRRDFRCALRHFRYAPRAGPEEEGGEAGKRARGRLPWRSSERPSRRLRRSSVPAPSARAHPPWERSRVAASVFGIVADSPDSSLRDTLRDSLGRDTPIVSGSCSPASRNKLNTSAS